MSAGVAVAGWLALGAAPALGCAVCFGAEGDPVASSLPIGVLVLLVPLLLVQGVLIRFLVRLMRQRDPAPSRRSVR